MLPFPFFFVLWFIIEVARESVANEWHIGVRRRNIVYVNILGGVRGLMRDLFENCLWYPFLFCYEANSSLDSFPVIFCVVRALCRWEVVLDRSWRGAERGEAEWSGIGCKKWRSVEKGNPLFISAKPLGATSTAHLAKCLEEILLGLFVLHYRLKSLRLPSLLDAFLAAVSALHSPMSAGSRSILWNIRVSSGIPNLLETYSSTFDAR